MVNGIRTARNEANFETFCNLSGHLQHVVKHWIQKETSRSRKNMKEEKKKEKNLRPLRARRSCRLNTQTTGRFYALKQQIRNEKVSSRAVSLLELGSFCSPSSFFFFFFFFRCKYLIKVVPHTRRLLPVNILAPFFPKRLIKIEYVARARFKRVFYGLQSDIYRTRGLPAF